jgi:type II secretory pathway pseudopilin PulG
MNGMGGCRLAPVRAAGFSVVEAVVALGIIAAGVATMAGLAARTTETVLRARQRSVATHLADATLTELAARGVAASAADCLLRDIAGCVVYHDAAGAVAAGPGGGYAVRWHAAAVPGSPVPATLLTVCAVPDADRRPSVRPPGACASRVVMEPWP